MFLGSVLDCVICQDIWDIGMGSLVWNDLAYLKKFYHFSCLAAKFCNLLVRGDWLSYDMQNLPGHLSFEPQV